MLEDLPLAASRSADRSSGFRLPSSEAQPCALGHHVPAPGAKFFWRLRARDSTSRKSDWVWLSLTNCTNLPLPFDPGQDHYNFFGPLTVSQSPSVRNPELPLQHCVECVEWGLRTLCWCICLALCVELTLLDKQVKCSCLYLGLLSPRFLVSPTRQQQFKQGHHLNYAWRSKKIQAVRAYKEGIET